MNMRHYACYLIALSLACTPATFYAKKFSDKVKANIAATNYVLENNPSNLMRIYITKENATQVINLATEKSFSNEQECKAFIKEQVDYLLKYVDSFVNTLRQKQDVVAPLVHESLGEVGAKILFDYLNTPGTLRDVLAEKLTSKEKLIEIASLIRTLFSDIEDNLSTKAKALFDEQKSKIDKVLEQKKARL